MITKATTIDLWQQHKNKISIVQREVLSRTIRFTIVADTVAVNLTASSVTLYAVKPDGTILFNACTIITATSGIVDYAITAQTVAVAGNLACTLVVVDGSGNELRSQPFVIEVIASPDYTSAVESSSEYTALESALALVSDHEDRITDVETDKMNLAGGATNPFTAMPYVGTAPIVESGSNANGTYIKYADGTMICTKAYAIGSTAVTTESGVTGLYQSAQIDLGAWAETFYAVPVVNNPQASNSDTATCTFWIQVRQTASNAPKGIILVPASLTLTTGLVEVTAIGRWKA